MLTLTNCSIESSKKGHVGFRIQFVTEAQFWLDSNIQRKSLLKIILCVWKLFNALFDIENIQLIFWPGANCMPDVFSSVVFYNSSESQLSGQKVHFSWRKLLRVRQSKLQTFDHRILRVYRNYGQASNGQETVLHP